MGIDKEACLTWIYQEIRTDSPSSVNPDWDTWQVGLIEDGKFRSIYHCFGEEEAIHLVSALNWYDNLEEKSFISIPKKSELPPKTKRSPKTKVPT